jgi:hypothetical protein
LLIHWLKYKLTPMVSKFVNITILLALGVTALAGYANAQEQGDTVFINRVDVVVKQAIDAVSQAKSAKELDAVLQDIISLQEDGYKQKTEADRRASVKLESVVKFLVPALSEAICAELKKPEDISKTIGQLRGLYIQFPQY